MRALLLPLLALPLACGPIGATSLIADADIAASRAHASDGMKAAPYETVSADLYLQKAKEEAGHARYGSAMELAQLAKGFAEAATVKSAQQRTGPMPVAPPSPTLHPATTLPAPTAPAAPAVSPPPPPRGDSWTPPDAGRPVLVPAGQGAPASPPAPREKKPIDPGAP